MIKEGCSQGLKTAPPRGWAWEAQGLSRAGVEHIFTLDVPEGWINRPRMVPGLEQACSSLTFLDGQITLFFSLSLFLHASCLDKALCPTNMC